MFFFSKYVFSSSKKHIIQLINAPASRERKLDL